MGRLRQNSSSGFGWGKARRSDGILPNVTLDDGVATAEYCAIEGYTEGLMIVIGAEARLAECYQLHETHKQSTANA